MGVMEEPSAADYANHNARDAQEKIEELTKRVEKLERGFAILVKRLMELEEDVDETIDDLDFRR